MEGSNLHTWENEVEDCHKFKANPGYREIPISTKTNQLKQTHKGLEHRPNGSRHLNWYVWCSVKLLVDSSVCGCIPGSHIIINEKCLRFWDIYHMLIPVLLSKPLGGREDMGSIPKLTLRSTTDGVAGSLSLSPVNFLEHYLNSCL